MLLEDLVYLSAGWHLIWLAIGKLYSRSSRKYMMSIFQILHSIIYIEESHMEFAQKKNQKSQILEDRDNMLKKLYKTMLINRYHTCRLYTGINTSNYILAPSKQRISISITI